MGLTHSSSYGIYKVSSATLKLLIYNDFLFYPNLPSFVKKNIKYIFYIILYSMDIVWLDIFYIFSY